MSTVQKQNMEMKARPTLGNDANQCMFCKHLTKMGHNIALDGWKCTAFGEHDIPGTILKGYWDHRERLINPFGVSDNGTIFEQAETDGVTFEELAGPFTEETNE